MLVLSRQRDETIMIGDNVEITVVDIRGDKVRLGITAPRHIQVHRKEVYDAIKRENQQAANVRPADVSEIMPSNAKQDEPREPKPPGKKNDNARNTDQIRGPQESLPRMRSAHHSPEFTQASRDPQHRW